MTVNAIGLKEKHDQTFSRNRRVNRVYTGLTGMVSMITIPVVVAWNRQPFLIWWGGSALCFVVILLVAAFV